MKKRISTVFITAFLILNIGITVFANAGPGYSKGRSSIGVMTVFDQSPIVVEKEILNIDISSVPEINTVEDSWLNDYSSCFTAEYRLYNPTEYDITTRLFFPFGNTPEYVEKWNEEGGLKIYQDKAKYSVKVNGEETDKKLRHTYGIVKFDAEQAIQELMDGQVKDEFFHPDMTVTKYVYRFDSDNVEEIDLVWKWENENGIRAVQPAYTHGYFMTESTMNFHPKKDGTIEFYIFGEPLDENPVFKDYSRSAKDWDTTGELIHTETQTLREYILKKYDDVDKGYMISESDWYNIYLRRLQNNINRDVMIISSFYDFEVSVTGVMNWYEYEITIPAGGRVVNTVTAPIYPTIYYDVNPYEYQYVYLLSPAEKWAEFKDIEININTPFEILKSTLSELEKTEKGYRYTHKSLPEGELEFTLSTGIKMPVQPNPYVKVFGGFMLIFCGCIGLFLWRIYRAIKKYEAEHGKFKG